MRYDDYLALLAMHESQGTGGYQADNGIGFIGKYQMGPSALKDTGFMDAQGNWTGKYGVLSADDFKNNPDAQEAAIDAFNMKNTGYLLDTTYWEMADLDNI